MAITYFGRHGPADATQRVQILYHIRRQVHLLPQGHPTKDHTVITMAHVVMTYVFPHFGIHSDNAPVFTSQVWEELSTLCGYPISHSSPYCPRGNAVCEQAHRIRPSAITSHKPQSHPPTHKTLFPS